MDYLEFETLKFHQQRGGRRFRLGKNMISVTLGNKGTSKVRFNVYMSKEIEGFKFLTVKRNPLTSQDYLVFNNCNGMNITKRNTKKDTSMGVSCKDFCVYLHDKYGGEGQVTFCLKISENKSNSTQYATYEIIGKVEK